MKKIILLAVLCIVMNPSIVNGKRPGCNLQIGDTFAGGIVFYLAPGDECHGLVCTPTDQSKDAKWSEADAMCPLVKVGGYTNWRLPNLYELTQMYSNLYKANLGGFSKGFYWSSNEYQQYYAWDLYFTNGQKYCSGKGTTGYVRAIRAF